MAKEKADAMDIFGLTVNQSRLLFSIEKYLVSKDIDKSKNDKDKKSEWLVKWEKSILEYLHLEDEKVDSLYGLYDIHKQIAEEKSKTDNLTWYYLVIFEAVLFHAYSPIDKNIKEYKSLKYKDQIDDIKEMVIAEGLIDVSFIDDIKDAYDKAVKSISGNNKKAFAIVPAIAMTVAVAALCSAFAGPIAVMLVGSNFAGLSGAALTSASLAMLGGGALAAGGAGMAGGTAVIVGGGALLGFATGGTASVAGITLLSSPEYAVSECAKIEVVILEILNKVQNDKDAAFLALKRFEDSIVALSEYMNDLNPKIKKEKTEIQKLKKSILYMKNTVEYIRKNI
ncbi:hypothetical protein SAMN05216391_102164 [Lachnospiraceae bacterium KHCPX20]|nr:hypothetical protein SAMN05216391_102164 [Lachnospiraceae bacterium KHCPX20]